MARLSALLIVIAMAAVTACSAAGSSTPSLTTTSTTAAPGAVFQQAFVSAVDNVRSSVVEIATSNALGSGIVFDTQGDIVTNNHVVSGASQFQVTFSDGQTVAATLVGVYPSDDLAVIKAARTTGLAPATFADSSQLNIGDITLAVGNPLGLASSVTQGIVSYNGRTVPEGNGVVLLDTIQTSAAINPGNSGGALVDLSGQVIGIPTLAATDPQLGGGAAPGIGFAIPSNTVKLIATQLIAQGTVTTPQVSLGITGASATNAQAQPGGVVVRTVQPGGPAANGGIRQGDVIVAINGTPTSTLSAVHEVLDGLKPGDNPSVTFVRGGARQTVHVTV